MRKIGIILVLSLGLMACGTGEKKLDKPKEEAQDQLETELDEQASSLVTSHVESPEVAQQAQVLVEEIIKGQDYLDYRVDQVFALVDKADKTRLVDLRINMVLDKPDKDEVEKIVEASSSLIEEGLASKYAYEKLELYWETPEHPQDNLLEIIYIK